MDIQSSEKHGGRPVGQIGVIQGDLRMRRFNPYVFETKLQKNSVAQIHATHQRKQLVITVRAFSGNLQEQVDFGGR